MNALETAIIAALKTKGDSKEANKAYLEFIKANFIMPVDIKQAETENPSPLYLVEGENVYVPVFSNQASLDNWVREIKNEIYIYQLSGVNLLKGIGDNVHICLDIGTNSYKLFLPAEIARMRSIILKFFN